MEFGWINLWGGGLTVVLILPETLYALSHTAPLQWQSHPLRTFAQYLGRWSCLLLMWLPLGVGEFGFSGIAAMLVYGLGTGVMAVAYLALWVHIWNHPSRSTFLTLAVLSGAIPLLSGLVLRHWLLVGASLLFSWSRISLTLENHR